MQNLTIFLARKRVGLFGSDWWEGAEKTSPGAPELTERPILVVINAKF